jgi:hypothetical protein
MSTTILPDHRARTAYFGGLAANRPVTDVIADQLSPLTSTGAKALSRCGRYSIGSAPIQLLRRSNGRVYVRGVKWCASRYCPNCQPRIMASLAWKRAERARAAKAAGYGISFYSVDVPDCGPGELHAQLDLLLETFRATLPAPSRLPVTWVRAGLSDLIGADWNVEIDWNADTGEWHPHIHALVYRQSAWTPDALAFLNAQWPWAALTDAQEAELPEAAARYSVKAENPKPHLLSLFDLARQGLTDQVGEYLMAVQGKRLRTASIKLGRLLDLQDDPADAELLQELDRAEGDSLGQLTLPEWRRAW